MIGNRLSHYKITAELGRGGMGIVYKARDTKLDRDVAIKVLPASALASEEDRARFYREAKAAAALNHPNIAQIYQIDEAVPDGGAAEEPRPFIAMELVGGETLEEHIKKGPLKLDEAVRIATQVASALKAAHSKDIVHRDIKSANIMLTDEGEPKVLDFGLAQTSASTKLTRMGSTLGTIAYMSPEQARGEEVDVRTDIYSLGAVLYEAISGKLPFGGEYEQAVVFSILNSDPEPLTAVRTGVPMQLEQIVSKLLRKDRELRYQTFADVIADLKALDISSSTTASHLSTMDQSTVLASPANRSGQPVRGRRNAVTFAAGALAGVVAVALIAFVIWPNPAPTAVPGSVKKFTLPVDVSFGIGAVDISPRGDKIAIASDVVQVIDLASGDTETFGIPGAPIQIDFSPSGRNLLLTMGSEHVRLDLQTRTTVNLGGTTEGGPRATWLDENSFFYEDQQAIFLRDLATEQTRQIVLLDSLSRNERDADSPFILPGGKVLMTRIEYWDDRSAIGFWDVESAELIKTLDVPAFRPQYVQPGFLVYIDDENLMGMPFSMETLEQTGPISTLDTRVAFEGMSVSEEGTLTHVHEQLGSNSETLLRHLEVVRRVGSSMNLVVDNSFFPVAGYRHAKLDPTGRFIAVAIHGEDPEAIEPPSDIWILNLKTGTQRPFTRGGNSDFPAWSPAGDSLYFVERADYDKILVAPLTNASLSKPVLEGDQPTIVDLSVSRDGRWAVAASGGRATVDAQTNAFLIDIKLGQYEEFESAAGNARQFDFSPDSRYFAYEDQGGIYVMEVGQPGLNQTMVWENSMRQPRWAPAGDYLYALSQESTQQGDAVRISLEPDFSVLGVPDQGFMMVESAIDPIFEVFPDGDTFLTFDAAFDPNKPEEEKTDVPTRRVDMTVIVNVHDLIQQ